MPRRTRPRGQTGHRRQRHKDVLHAGDGHRANVFRCVGCRLDVPTDAPGTAHRNHCPNCLASRHVDRRIPGDRDADCRGRMEPVAVCTRPDGEWMIVHQCLHCGELSTNRIAGDDNALALVRLALKPLQDTDRASRTLLSL